MDPPMSMDLFQATHAVRSELRSVQRLLRQLKYVGEARSYVSANKTLETTNRLAVQLEQEQLAMRIGTALSDASARIFLLTEDVPEEPEIVTTRAFKNVTDTGQDSLVLNELSVQQLKILPACFAAEQFDTYEDAQNDCVPLAANNHYVLSAVADFVVALQHSMGSEKRPSTHPGVKVENYEEDFVGKVRQGLVVVLEWLKKYGIMAWYHDICDHAKDIVRLVVQLLASLARNFCRLFDSIKWPLAEELVNIINEHLKYIWDLLYVSGAISTILVQGMSLPSGVLIRKPASKRKPERFMVKPSRRRTKLAVKSTMVSAWPWLHMTPSRELLLAQDFVDAFAKLFRVPLVAGRRILDYMTYDDILQCQLFVEFWVKGGEKLVIAAQYEDNARKRQRVE